MTAPIAVVPLGSLPSAVATMLLNNMDSHFTSSDVVPYVVCTAAEALQNNDCRGVVLLANAGDFVTVDPAKAACCSHNIGVLCDNFQLLTLMLQHRAQVHELCVRIILCQSDGLPPDVCAQALRAILATNRVHKKCVHVMPCQPHDSPGIRENARRVLADALLMLS